MKSNINLNLQNRVNRVTKPRPYFSWSDDSTRTLTRTLICRELLRASNHCNRRGASLSSLAARQSRIRMEWQYLLQYTRHLLNAKRGVAYISLHSFSPDSNRNRTGFMLTLPAQCHPTATPVRFSTRTHQIRLSHPFVRNNLKLIHPLPLLHGKTCTLSWITMFVAWFDQVWRCRAFLP